MYIPAILNNPIIVKYNELKGKVLDNQTIQQILYTIATILGFTVGITVWIANRVGDWYNQGGKETLLKYIERFLLFVNNTTEKLYFKVCVVTESELAH